MSKHNKKPGKVGSKRLFVGLITGVSALICLVLAVGWLIPYFGFTVSPAFTYLTGALLVLIILTVAWISFSMVMQILTGNTSFGARKTRALAAKLFLPVSEILGRFLRIDQQAVRASFIQVNNDMTLKSGKKYDPHELLILLPHCIQWSGCPIRVSSDNSRCKRCGNCDVGSLLELSERYGVHMAIATGGTIARRIVVKTKPKMILAVACERDLASGIQDTHPLTVYGILNERPNGPCVDTRVSLERVEESLKFFIKPEKLPAAISST
jgi:hypothetical protein